MAGIGEHFKRKKAHIQKWYNSWELVKECNRMNKEIVKAVEEAVNLIVADFQNNTTRFWNERDIHWGLFYYLKKENVVPEKYPGELIRAEFPTLNRFGNKETFRGHYDLVVLEEKSYRTPEVQAMKAQTEWADFLPMVNLTVVVEIKLWLARLQFQKIKWDVDKLTEKPHKVLNAFLLNFVQLDFDKHYNQDYYKRLRQHLMCFKKKFPDVKILCVPSEKWVQADSSDNWLEL